MQVFAHLARTPQSAPTISPDSLIALLGAFVRVLDEPGLRAARGDECVRIIVETLLHYGPDQAGTDSLQNSVQTYLSSRRIDRGLFGDAETAGQFEDVSGVELARTSPSNADSVALQPIDSLVSALSKEQGYTLPDIYASLSLEARTIDQDASAPDAPFDLPYMLVPPEVEQSELVRAAPTSQSSSGLRGDEAVGYDGVRLHFRLFDDEVRYGKQQQNESAKADVDPFGRLCPRRMTLLG